MGIVINWSIENYRNRWLPHKLEKTMKTSPTRRKRNQRAPGPTLRPQAHNALHPDKTNEEELLEPILTSHPPYITGF